MSQHYIPPLNFGMVEEDLFRSSHPNELNFPFLEKLNLKTIIYLAPEEPSPSFYHFIDDHGIELHHLGEDASLVDALTPLTEEMVLAAMRLVLNPAKYPLAIMCQMGRHRTGTLVGCLRKLQNWNLASISEEYRRFTGPRVRVLNEQFIELFDTDLIRIPDNPPPWLLP